LGSKRARGSLDDIGNGGSPVVRSGLTILEVVLVVLILGVIAAIAVPRISSVESGSKYNATHAGFRNITRSFEMYFVDHLGYPPNGAVGERPAEMEGYLPESAFTVVPPFGRAWDWNGDGSGIMAHGPNLSIHTTAAADRVEMDTRFDDGEASTGMYRVQSHYLVWPMMP